MKVEPSKLTSNICAKSFEQHARVRNGLLGQLAHDDGAPQLVCERVYVRLAEGSGRGPPHPPRSLAGPPGTPGVVGDEDVIIRSVMPNGRCPNPTAAIPISRPLSRSVGRYPSLIVLGELHQRRAVVPAGHFSIC